MADVAIWWLAVELLGLVALPASLALFRNLPDRGYAFAKPLAILVLSYLLWLLGTLHVLPNERWSLVLLASLLALGSLVLFVRRRVQVVTFLRQNLALVITVELLFLVAFVLWAAVRASSPDIWGTEKPMDFAFLNAVLRSDYFPPYDPWLSGHSISYYYFGHLMVASLTRLTGVLPAVGFNLGLALVFALTAAGAFGIVYNLVRLVDRDRIGRAIGFGAVAAGLVVLAGNLQGVLEVAYAHGLGSQGFWGWLGIKGLEQPYHSAQWYPTEFWWWWRASRVIDTVSGGVSLDYTIQEFPAFSFLLGDLHPHVMALPFGLLALGLALNTFMSKSPLGLAWLRRAPLHYLVTALALGALGFLNSWDLPTYFLLFVAAAFFAAYFRHGALRGAVFKETAITAALLAAGAVLLYLPFYSSVETRVGGILPVRGPGTRPIHYFVVWGLFLFAGVSLAMLRWRDAISGWRGHWPRYVGAVLLSLAPLVLWASIELGVSAATRGLAAGLASVAGRVWALLPLLLILALMLLTLLGVARRASEEPQHRGYVFGLGLAFVGLYLTFGAELFYVLDIFSNRMNTVFKLYFQAWPLLAIASALGLYYLSCVWRPKQVWQRAGKGLWWLCCVVLLASALVYIVAGVPSRATEHSGPATLNGLDYLERRNPAEYQAIRWLGLRVAGAPVVLEAVGDEWSDCGRVSSNTGLPTVLGWAGHERQWRGSSVDYQQRERDVAEVYTSQDASRVRALLDKYEVQYVYFGDLERQSYGATLGAGLEAVAEAVYSEGGVTIYRMRGGQGGP